MNRERKKKAGGAALGTLRRRLAAATRRPRDSQPDRGDYIYNALYCLSARNNFFVHLSELKNFLAFAYRGPSPARPVVDGPLTIPPSNFRRKVDVIIYKQRQKNYFNKNLNGYLRASEVVGVIELSNASTSTIFIG